MEKSFGLLIDPIDVDRDWVFGSALSAGGVELQPDGNWLPYIPQGEEQYNTSFDSQACASFGTTNAIEILKRRLFGSTENYSDRFVAKGSDTTPQGNSPHKVAEFIRKSGMVYEPDYPFTADLTTWEKFYSAIPENLMILAQGIMAELDFTHEYVPTYAIALMNALKYSPLGISVYAWIKDPLTGLYYQPLGYANNHWVVLLGYKKNEYWLIYDSYDLGSQGDYLKKLTWDHPFSIAKKYTLVNQVAKKNWFAVFLMQLRNILHM